MSNTYTIKNSAGTFFATINELQRDRSTSLVLHGRGAKNYGFERDQNILYLLENFSSTTAPSNPVVGQLWWDRTNRGLFVRTGSPQTWTTVVPTDTGVGFNVVAGAGLAGGGFPTGSPEPGTTTLNIGAGTGISINGSPSFIFTNDAAIIHDNLSGFVLSEHVDHSSVSLTAGAGLTGGGTIAASRTINVGAGDGITANANDIAVNSTVVRTSGNQTISGIKTFTAQIFATTSGSPAPIPAYGFTTDTDTGMFLSDVNELSFTTGGTQRFRIESGGVLRSLNATYESLVTEDDDIPNKAYIDSLSSAGGTPTENTFVGTSSITGLTIGKKYLVGVYGFTLHRSTGTALLGSVRVGTGTFPGTLIAATPTQVINWHDGSKSGGATFVITAPSTTINGMIDYITSTNHGFINNMTAVQLN